MRLFLDASVLLAACASARGASREIFRLARMQGWVLVATPYVIEEVLRNLPEFSMAASAEWVRLRAGLLIMDDVLTVDRPWSSPRTRTSRFSSVRGLGGCAAYAGPRRFRSAFGHLFLRDGGAASWRIPGTRKSGGALAESVIFLRRVFALCSIAGCSGFDCGDYVLFSAEPLRTFIKLSAAVSRRDSSGFGYASR